MKYPPVIVLDGWVIFLQKCILDEHNGECGLPDTSWSSGEMEYKKRCKTGNV